MAKTIQLTFYINLTDRAAVTALQAQYPLGVSRGPLPAATEFSAPYQAEGTPTTYPCTRTAWLPPGAAGKFPLDRAFFTINDGFFGHLFGRDQKYAWIGQFVYQAPIDLPPQVEGEEQAAGPMCEVAFAIGFEGTPVGSQSNAEGFTASGNSSSRHCRDSSSTPEGWGIAKRDDSGSDQIVWSVFGASMGTRAWERMKIRIRKFPTGDDGFWRMRWNSNQGLTLQINSSGAILVRHHNSGGTVGALMGQTDPLASDVWILLDILYNNSLTKQSVRLFINHTEAVNIVDFLHGEASANNVPISSLIGGGNNGLELDIDDWIGFKPPDPNTLGRNELWNEGSVPIVPGPDWTHGHHVAYVPVEAYDATHSAAGWGTGDVRGLNQRSTSQQAWDVLTSTTSGALVAATTRGDLVVNQDGSLGWQAIVISALLRRATAGTPQLGAAYSEAGEAATTVMTNINNPGTTNLWSAVAIRPTPISEPKALDSLMLRLTKAADANSTQVCCLMATILLVGTFGQADLYPPPPDEEEEEGETPIMPAPLRSGIHNAPYPRTPWNRTEVPPDSPVWIKSGTYTGNSLGQDVITKIPAHFWWVRKTDTAVGAARWFSSMLGGKRAIAGDTRDSAVYAEEDPEFASPGGPTDAESRSLLRISGAATAENVSGGTYQYLAIGDPGMRFMLNGMLKHLAAATVETNLLTDPDFLPEWMWAVTEFPGGGGFWWQKGPGHAAPNGQRVDASEVATIGNFGTGSFDSRATLHPSGSNVVPYSMWRNRDGADYEGLEIDEPVVVQIFSIVGDGAASRTIQLPRVSGKRPLWAYGQAANSASAVVRDPSHTSTNSSTPASGSTVITTGFTAGGIDSITIGTTLNVSGQAVNFFVVMGDATAGNNGWGANTEVLIDPVPAPGGQWDPGYSQEELDELENPTVPPDVDSFDDGPDLADDLADPLCVPFTLRAVNLAFARIGIADKMTAASDLLTPTSQERSLAAEFFETTLRYVLRDYPWAHATGYAALELVEGSISDPVNADWVYSFRAPSGCLFVRRIIRPEVGRKHDPKPPAYRMIVDTVGPLVFVTDDGVQFDSNDEPFIEVEYTVRPPCGSKAGGDQKFVSAFAYRLAFELATALSRDEKTVLRMERGYMGEKMGASTTVGLEQQQQPPGDPDWLRGR